MLNKKAIIASAAVAAMCYSSVALAADGYSAAPASAPLAPGSAAGVLTAQDFAPINTAVVVGGIVVVGVGIALLASGGGKQSTSSTTTTGPR